MAEAILTMTILGIIASIMITSLKPAEYRDKGLKVHAKKIFGEIDDATTQIIVNNTRAGKFDGLMNDTNTASAYSIASSPANAAILYKRYLVTTRKDITQSACNSYTTKFALKDGACMGINANTTGVNAIFPGETTQANISGTLAEIFFDVNSEEEPNTFGKDQYLLPIGADGIKFE